MRATQGRPIQGRPTQSRPTPSATDQVHALLREAIISGRLPIGSRHSIYQLAEEFGVSRTPVRDAVLRLADTGMLQIERNRGVRVRGLTVDEIREIFEARLLIEVPAARRAAEAGDESLIRALDDRVASLREAVAADDAASFMRHDRALHEEILRASGNLRLVQFVSSLRDATQAWGASTVGRTRGLEEIEVEHLPIIEAIRRRDPDGAARVMREHLIHTGLLLMQQVAVAGGEAAPDRWPDRIRPED